MSKEELLCKIWDWYCSFEYAIDNFVLEKREFEIYQEIVEGVWEEWGEELQQYLVENDE